MSEQPKEKKKGMLNFRLTRRIFGLAAPYKTSLYTGVVLTLVGAWLAPYRTKLIQV